MNTGSYTSTMTGLSEHTVYYVRAFAINEKGTSYGTEYSFETTTGGGGGGVVNLPTVITYSVTNITESSAYSGGEVTSDGGSTVTARGVCWSTTENPTISNSHTTDGTGAGAFTSALTNLTPQTTYYVRAYATNEVGTAYGEQKIFTAGSDITAPTVTTNDVSSVTSNSAVCGGNVTDNGGGIITARGICYGTSQNPTINDTHTSDGDGTGMFISNLTGLTENTTYYVRAYATNEAGTSYGEQKSFTTESDIPTPPTWTNGILPGLFSVSETQQVQFSQGNLQYQASTNTWRFAEYQWNYIGNDNSNISSSYSGWIDLFGWGTGDNPTNSSTNPNDYSSYNNWGNNSISNGGKYSKPMAYINILRLDVCYRYKKHFFWYKICQSESKRDKWSDNLARQLE